MREKTALLWRGRRTPPEEIADGLALMRPYTTVSVVVTGIGLARQSFTGDVSCTY